MKEEEAKEKEEAWKDRFLRGEAQDKKKIFAISSSSNLKKRQGITKMRLSEISPNLRKNLTKANIPKTKKKKEKEDS